MTTVLRYCPWTHLNISVIPKPITVEHAFDALEEFEKIKREMIGLKKEMIDAKKETIDVKKK